MKTARVWLAGVAAIAVLFALFALLRRPSGSVGGRGDAEEPSSAWRPYPEPPVQKGSAVSAPAPADGGRRRLDPGEHAALQKQIHEALWAASGQAPPSSAGGPVGAPPAAAELSREYIRERIQSDFKPMAIKCYEELLARAPDAGGRAVLEFTIVADEKLGAVVEDPALGDGGTLTDPRFATCLRESLGTVAFAAPAKGGKTTVRYPLVFSPGPDEDAAAKPAP
ncbi:MAG TPA: AgmX/PglI C-terminal domain-containing protein [Polyangiaceae bacterium]|nr:AgmX/PglI C-terminal domain-containing protein [Polyangiaceae bacterium]